MIVWNLESDGSFVCGDTETRCTSYAYPRSAYANRAIAGRAQDVADEMIEAQNRFRENEERAMWATQDNRNWAKLAKADVHG